MNLYYWWTKLLIVIPFLLYPRKVYSKRRHYVGYPKMNKTLFLDFLESSPLVLHSDIDMFLAVPRQPNMLHCLLVGLSVCYQYIHDLTDNCKEILVIPWNMIRVTIWPHKPTYTSTYPSTYLPTYLPSYLPNIENTPKDLSTFVPVPHICHFGGTDRMEIWKYQGRAHQWTWVGATDAYASKKLKVSYDEDALVQIAVNL